MKSERSIQNQKAAILNVIIHQLRLIPESGGYIAPKLLRLTDEFLKNEQMGKMEELVSIALEAARRKCRAAVAKARDGGPAVLSRGDAQLLIDCLYRVIERLASSMGEGRVEWLWFKTVKV
ncbi:hypothetical protein [Chromobacterium sp. Panama]|uniref:hypothetical protein n=1 Tax=Chromobacterium sp. Panama TaxID=2161826 RepID=UPI0011B27E7C|nr:hypothetical protein [Chromobacterium sp. Panama]